MLLGLGLLLWLLWVAAVFYFRGTAAPSNVTDTTEHLADVTALSQSSLDRQAQPAADPAPAGGDDGDTDGVRDRASMMAAVAAMVAGLERRLDGLRGDGVGLSGSEGAAADGGGVMGAATDGRCAGCAPGDPVDGGVALQDGICRASCSKNGFCGCA